MRPIIKITPPLQIGVCFGHNPFRLGLGCTPGMILAILGGPRPDTIPWPAGGLGSQAASGRCPKSFNSKLKFLRFPVLLHNRPHNKLSFTHRLSIIRYPAGNRAVIGRCMQPQRRIFWDWTWANIRPMSVYPSA